MRQACRIVGLSFSSFYYQARPSRNTWLVERLQEIASVHPRYGYRRALALLRRERVVNHKRGYRLWKQMGLGLKGHRRRTRRGVGTLPMQVGYPGHIWTYDFVHDACMNGQKLKLLTVVDAWTREALAIEVSTTMPTRHVQTVLSRLFHEHGAPQFLRSDNGPEFLAQLLQRWLGDHGTRALYIEPGCPWQNGKGESCNGRFRDACLNAEVFLNLVEARVCIERWRQQYNMDRPHSSLGYRTPDEFKQAVRF